MAATKEEARDTAKANLAAVDREKLMAAIARVQSLYANDPDQRPGCKQSESL